MEPEQKSNGALIGSIIIIVILVLGGVYLWQNKMKEATPPPGSNLSGSDDTANMEADVNSIGVESVDNGI